MTFSNAEFPDDRSGREPAGLRPMPVGAGAGGGGGTNRPIPVQSRPDQVPEAYEQDDEEQDDLREILRNAPAWLVSTVFHTLVLIILGVLAASNHFRPVDVDLEVARDETEGVQLEDPSVLQGDSPILENAKGATEQLITPRDLPPVDNPLAAPIELGDIRTATGPGLGPVLTGPMKIEGAPIGLALKGRQAGSKNVLLGKYGGTAIGEKAVEAGLEWLAKQQKSNGLWSLTGPYADAARTENDAAATAMALLAFQGHGDTHREGKHSRAVARGWAALLKLQNKEGLFSGIMPESNQVLYTHAQCSIALCELYGMTMDSNFRGPAERAIAYALKAQDPKNGGWRYRFGEDSDTSVTGWFVMALQSARMAQLKVPDDALKRVSDYLDLAQIDEGRKYGYWQKLNPSNAVAAEGLLCRQYLGWKQDDPRLVDGVGGLLKSPIAYDGGLGQDVYYWYYATQAAHHMEGRIWEEWNAVMRKELPAHQQKNGPEAGSWNPQGDKWGSPGFGAGRLFVTCLSVYMLEVYYRHLPIYSGYRAIIPGAEPSAAPPAEPMAKADAEDGAEPKNDAAASAIDCEKSKPEKSDAAADPALKKTVP